MTFRTGGAKEEEQTCRIKAPPPITLRSGWNSIYKRFNAWSAAGKWLKIFKALLIDPNFEWVFIDGTYAKAHQHCTGAVNDQPEAIGKSHAGNTSKNPLGGGYAWLACGIRNYRGEVNGCTVTPELIAQLPSAEVIVADKSYDSERIRRQVEAQGARSEIPRKRNSVKGNADLDRGWSLEKDEAGKLYVYCRRLYASVA